MAIQAMINSRWKTVTKAPKGRVDKWRIDFRDQNNRRRREVLGDTTWTRANEIRLERNSQVRRGAFINPTHAHEQLGPTFADFIKDTFLPKYGDLRKSNYYADNLKESSQIVKFFGEKRIRAITEEDIDDYKQLRSTEVGPSTLKKNLTLIGTVFKLAKRWKAVTVNVATDIDKPKEPKHKVQYLKTRDEYERLLTKCQPWLRPLIRFATATGMRLGEITALRWEDIDRKAKLIYVPESGKTGLRAIPLNKTAAAVLDGAVRRLRNPFVFTNADGESYDGKGTRNTISGHTRNAMSAAGIADGSFHVLRHTFASWAVQSGRPLEEIRELLGHSTAQMTLRYAHLAPKHLVGTTRAIDDVLGSKDGPRQDEPVAMAMGGVVD